MVCELWPFENWVKNHNSIPIIDNFVQSSALLQIRIMKRLDMHFHVDFFLKNDNFSSF